MLKDVPQQGRTQRAPTETRNERETHAQTDAPDRLRTAARIGRARADAAPARDAAHADGAACRSRRHDPARRTAAGSGSGTLCGTRATAGSRAGGKHPRHAGQGRATSSARALRRGMAEDESSWVGRRPGLAGLFRRLPSAALSREESRARSNRSGKAHRNAAHRALMQNATHAPLPHRETREACFGVSR